MNWEEWAATHQTRHHAKLEDWAIDFLKKLPVLYIVNESGVSRTSLYCILRGGQCRKKTKEKLMDFIREEELTHDE